jgi:outer membrane protein OmpA-like peptidoglycan-associated protein
MKKLILLLIVGHAAISTTAQNKEEKDYTTDKEMSRWVLDLNMLVGGYAQQSNMANTTPNYLNGINVNPGNIGFRRGGTLGGEIQLGYFFDNNKNWGLGTGLLYLREWGTVTLNNFHAEYQSTDNNGFVFRQVVSSNDIREQIKIDNFNIPLVLKFKNKLSERWGITADAGVLFNLQMKNNYTTNASFDYEAIYKFINENNGSVIPVYDNSIIPDKSDFLITKNHFSKNNPSGNVQDYFNTKREAGYNVGLGVQANQQKGSTTYTASSVGFIFQPSVSYYLSERVALNLGAYFLYQPFKNDASGTYTLTDKPGSYNSVMNSAEKIQTQSFGGNIGLRFFLGKNAKRMAISSIDQYNPTNCGSCNGSMALHGLNAGASATLNYTVNGKSASSTGFVDNQGTLAVNNLCSGKYADINATIGDKTAKGKSFSLTDPKLIIGTVESVNPSGPNKCDGTITIYGLNAGQSTTVTYTTKGTKQSVTGIVGSDNSFKVSGLCEGMFTNIYISSNNCNAQINNPSTISLKSLKSNDQVFVENDSLNYVLFEYDKSTIRPYSYALIDEAYIQLKNNSDAYLVIDGNTDKIGSDEYNQKLSERRAQAVKDYLVAKGISESRISMEASGERDPVATNSTDAGRTLNRRAEMRLKIK